MANDDSAGRLFVGVPMTEDARAAIQAHLREALPGGMPGRPVPAANWHLTLRFLGATTAEQLRIVRDQLDAAELGDAFQVRFGGAGAFPRPRSARVLWIGVSDSADRLRELARIAEDAARAAGFAPEGKPYRPHLTLARIQPPEDVTRALAAIPPADVAMPVREMIVFRSHLGGGPARYEPVERIPLR